MLDLGNMVVNKVIVCKLSWIYDRSCVLQMGVWVYMMISFSKKWRWTFVAIKVIICVNMSPSW